MEEKELNHDKLQFAVFVSINFEPYYVNVVKCQELKGVFILASTPRICPSIVFIIVQYSTRTRLLSANLAPVVYGVFYKSPTVPFPSFGCNFFCPLASLT